MKIRASTKIFIGFLVLVGLVFGGKALWARIALGDAHFEPLKPQLVNLIGVDTRAGYHIVVANRIAQMVLGSRGDFEQGDNYDPGAEDEVKKRVPIRELLASLNGDEQALSTLVMRLNDFKDEEIETQAPVWRAEDLEKALGGDKEFESRLIADLNCRIDGTPLDVLRVDALESGIIIDMPVPVTVKPAAGGKAMVLTARVREPYRTRFADRVFQRYKEKSKVTAELVQGYYREEAQAILDNPASREDVSASIRQRIEQKRARQFAELPEKILNSIEVIINGSQMQSARLEKREVSEGRPYYDLHIDLNDEGRDRLWKYSQGRVGTQLLLVWRGVAVAAPRIDHELAERQVTITQLEDEGIAEMTAEAINGGSSGEQKR